MRKRLMNVLNERSLVIELLNNNAGTGLQLGAPSKTLSSFAPSVQLNRSPTMPLTQPVQPSAQTCQGRGELCAGQEFYPPGAQGDGMSSGAICPGGVPQMGTPISVTKETIEALQEADTARKRCAYSFLSLHLLHSFLINSQV